MLQLMDIKHIHIFACYPGLLSGLHGVCSALPPLVVPPIGVQLGLVEVSK